jgi:hypothetical protein
VDVDVDVEVVLADPASFEGEELQAARPRAPAAPITSATTLVPN